MASHLTGVSGASAKECNFTSEAGSQVQERDTEPFVSEAGRTHTKLADAGLGTTYETSFL